MRKILDYILIVLLIIVYIPFGLFAIITFYLSKLSIKVTDYLQSLITQLNTK